MHQSEINARIDRRIAALLDELARFLYVQSLGLLGFAVVATVVIWNVAYHDGMLISAERLAHWTSNHDPWHDYEPGYASLNAIVLALLFGAGSTLLSVFIKPKRQTGILLICQVIAFLVAFYWWLGLT